MQHKKDVIISSVLAAFVLISIFISIFCDSYALKKKVTALDNRITDIFKTAFPDVKRIVDPLQQMRVKTDAIKKNSTFPDKAGKNVPVIDILDEISKAIPEDIDVALARLVISPENMMISGDTKTFNFVDDMKSRLEKVKIFKKVTISSANIDRSGNRVRFKLKIEL